MEIENKTTNAQVETYAEDIAQAIEESQGGFIKKIIHEQEYNENKRKNLSLASRKNKIFLSIGVL